MKVTFIEHSGFMVEMEQNVLLFDYYQGEIPSFDGSKTLYVFASHSHADHYDPAIWKLKEQYKDIHYILSDDIKDNEVADEDMGMLPIYIGVDGEENQGLCTGSENYWCVNKNASEEDIQATLDFMKWVVESDEGRDMLANEMGFVTPFTTFSDYLPDNPLVKANAEYTEAGKTPVSWNFTTMPSENWKNNLGGALLNYAQGTGAWDSVQTAFVDGWAEEYAAANE